MIATVEAPRFHRAARRRGCVAALGARATAGYITAPYRCPARRFVVRKQGSEAVPAGTTRCRVFPIKRVRDRLEAGGGEATVGGMGKMNGEPLARERDPLRCSIQADRQALPLRFEKNWNLHVSRAFYTHLPKNGE
jgi:hypothetical protein